MRRSPSLPKIIRDTAARMRFVDVTVNTLHDTVSIGPDIFLQGEDAANFIQEAEDLYHKARTVSKSDCYACVAAPIYETLSH